MLVPGIQALRGIAVVAVILNHYHQPLLPGGFLGVDIFFVISGFVVTKSLLRISTKNSVTYLLTFYSKRAKRIAPALIVFIGITFTLLFFLAPPNIYTQRTGALALVGLSNLYLAIHGNNYFGLDTQFNLFAHTWSLGIEEQFYVLLPLVFLFLNVTSQNSVSRRTTLFLGLIVCSFLTFVFLRNNISLQYYSPVARFWELMLGSIAFQLYDQGRLRIDRYFSKFFLLIIGICLMLGDQYFLFSAPASCIASTLLILSVSSEAKKNQCGLVAYLSTISTPLKSILIYLGTISFSLYLYHFPIIRLLNLPGYWALLQFGALLMIAHLSYRLVEQPFRFRLLQTRTPIFLVTTTAALLMAISTILIYLSFTFPSATIGSFDRPKNQLFPPLTVQELNEFADKRPRHSRSIIGNPYPYKNKRTLFFIGDSHSDALSGMMEEFHHRCGVRVYSILSTGPTFSTLDGLHGSAFVPISNHRRIYIDFLKDFSNPGDVLIITNQWKTWFSRTYNDPENDHILIDNKEIVPKDIALARYKEDLKQLASILGQKGVEILTIGPFPDWAQHPIESFSPILNFLGMPYQPARYSRLVEKRRREQIVSTFTLLADELENFHFLDPLELFCDEVYCSAYDGVTPLYYDDDHVNQNALPLLFGAVTEIFSSFEVLPKEAMPPSKSTPLSRCTDRDRIGFLGLQPESVR
jgi:peptidoglycan/LPS O-acetylase OafA/YrhL